MIVGVLPFVADGFGYEVFAYLVVDVGFMGLAELVAPSHIVHLAVFDETGARLVEAEWDVLRDTLLAEGQDPGVVAGTGIDS